MSLKPVHITQGPFFYPVGNTPAVCLTQSLPREQDAALLLLGCGDIRNILFTAYSGAGADDRKLDFTCCDIEAEIIARNVLALTLILDDTKGTRVRQLWNLYYHIFIDGESAGVLRSQSKKLLELAHSLKSWNEGPYGSTIRFCDSTTLENVTKLWALYALEPVQDETYKVTQDMLKDQWQAAKQVQALKTSGTASVGDGIRAFAPLLTQGFEEADKAYKTYWKTGTCLEDNKAIKNLSIANPMFVCHRSGLVLHYGTSPLTGFHLAPMYARLAADSPLFVSSETTKGKLPKPMQIALDQLSAWCFAFRKASMRLTIRYVNSDAGAFCHVIQHQQAHGESRTACWYRNVWTYTPLVLDAPEYELGGSAPATFDVIDTSNLLDYVGCLNILAASASLIRQNASSILRTEMLIPSEIDMAASASALLCGHLPTIALLLGLKPVQYWTNATSVWHLNVANSPDLNKTSMFAAATSRPIVLWKPVNTSKIRYDAAELARLLMSMYLNMFQDEGWANQFSILGLGNAELQKKKLTAYELYTRASFVSLLQHIKVSNVVDWSPFMHALVEVGIMNDTTLNMGPHHLQSLLVYLDMLGVWKVEDSFEWWHPRTFKLGGPFRKWEDIPTLMCVTLVVPHDKVSMFGELANGHGTPLCQLQLNSSISPKEALYTDIQMGFGTIETSGSAFTNDYRVMVQEDDKGWKGKSPLIVSTMVSTCTLTEEEDDACGVTFGLKSTPTAQLQFMSMFGMLLHVHRSALGQKDVFVSRYRPGFQGFVSVNKVTTSKATDVNDVIATIHPLVSSNRNEVESLRVHYSVISGKAKELLQSGAIVSFETTTAFTLRLSIGKTYLMDVVLPFPPNAASAKTKIARKSLWIEYTAAVQSGAAILRRPDNMMPVHLNEQHGVSLEQLHYVQPDVLPKLLLGQKASFAKWIGLHPSPMATMSAGELKAYQKSLADVSSTMPGRLGVKETLQSIYAHLVGAEGQAQAKIIQFCTPTSFFGILYIDSVRMDLSNQTLLVDAAYVPFHTSADMAPLAAVLAARRDDAVGIKMKEDEVAFWKHLLPGFAERCRQWQHKPTCEYKVAGRIPISTDPDKRYMCTCGYGVFPANYLKDLKQSKDLFKHAVRVAVPVIFASPINTDDPASLPSPSPPAKPPAKPQAQAPVDKPEPRLVDLGAKEGTCWECSAKRHENGGALSKCAACKVAHYCSEGCQKKDWKNGHRQLCPQLKED
ncbi:uncharacterized protein J4E78_001440 [Alternaria triticimaculans]|uniref:uncharacterized protein n=1 Tax=Alternaria triticimaculans TaxID=297637 RepID=UPI0020C39C1F|nr:uncharacterized protein J4E78_001440 [Alternaria triticimaculans]KAI4672937.1 hypothetical protein J4E78_001440 [Alternaria triticimaculans]